jgi:hypothetical protein
MLNIDVCGGQSHGGRRGDKNAIRPCSLIIHHAHSFGIDRAVNADYCDKRANYILRLTLLSWSLSRR